jgi:predicted dinucleotide-binding enzyme
MKVGVLGTGTVGRTISARLVELGHDVTIGTRDVAALLASTEPNQITQQTFADRHAQNAGVGLASFAEAAEHGELMVNATNGADSLEALRAAGEANLDGKVLIDIANPLELSQRTPPGWRHVLDLGDITTARGTEMYLPLWIRIWGALGSGTFNVAVVQ